jgi:hypothetical protein
MEDSFKSLVEKSKSILILLPTKPYFDQVAAGLSLFLSLRDVKQVHISSVEPMLVEHNKLVGVNKITQDLGSKNLVVRFTDYKANDIERVSYDIEDGQFRLTVIPKQNVKPPEKDQVNLSYSGVAADTVILIGGANESHFPAISSKDLAVTNLIHIGTRDITLTSKKSFISFAKPASSVSEVVFSLIKEAGYSIDEDISTNLIMGIEKGSNDFAGPEVGPGTFAAVSELMKSGGRRTSQVPQPATFPAGAVPKVAPTPGIPAGQAQQPPFGGGMQQGQQPRVPMQPGQAQPQVQMQPQVNKFQGQQAQPRGASVAKSASNNQPPEAWLKQPKVYKGTSIS